MYICIYVYTYYIYIHMYKMCVMSVYLYTHTHLYIHTHTHLSLSLPPPVWICRLKPAARSKPFQQCQVSNKSKAFWEKFVQHPRFRICKDSVKSDEEVCNVWVSDIPKLGLLLKYWKTYAHEALLRCRWPVADNNLKKDINGLTEAPARGCLI